MYNLAHDIELAEKSYQIASSMAGDFKETHLEKQVIDLEDSIRKWLTSLYNQRNAILHEHDGKPILQATFVAGAKRRQIVVSKPNSDHLYPHITKESYERLVKYLGNDGIKTLEFEVNVIDRFGIVKTLNKIV